MFEKLLKPQTDVAALILRLGLAAIFIVHGYVKLYVSFVIHPMTAETQAVVGWVEVIGGVLLAIGLFSRLAAVALIVVQTGAIFLVTHKHTLDVIAGNGSAEDYRIVGPEYNLILIAMCLGVIVLGSGMLSVDHLIVSCLKRSKARGAPAPATTPGPAGAT